MTEQLDIKKDFDTLFRKHYKMAVLYAHKYVYDVEAARDIAQNVFIKLYDKKEEIALTSSIKSYILGAVKNASLNHIRGRDVRNKHNELAMERVSTSYEHHTLEYQDLMNSIQSELKNLPPRCQEIFKMNRLKGMKNKEIAAQLNISIRTVETQVSNALKHLRRTIPKNLLFLLILFVLTTCFTASACPLNEPHQRQTKEKQQVEWTKGPEQLTTFVHKTLKMLRQ